MLKALIIIGALVAGYVMYLGLQPQIPAQLSFLKLDTSPATRSAVVAASKPEPPASVSSAGAGWTLASMGGGAWALSQQMDADIRVEVQGQILRYQAPVLYAICQQGKLYAELDTRAALRQASAVVNGHPEELKQLGAGPHYALTSPKILLESAERGAPLRITLPFRDAGSQVAEMSATAMRGLATLLPKIGCQA